MHQSHIFDLLCTEYYEKYFRFLSKEYHPDATGNAADSISTERFLAIKEAYDVLKDAESRRDYDAHRAQTSSEYARNAYNSQTYRTGYGTWRSV
ncbi:unnamed protein product [Gongylonema pulchrum]|uniref:J domain-containing protein n=1 Tax=Gongylonema pulchrum TaxID=637853 RepID=A0A183EWN5_9BILA|nr:unnamed protein product [Gongylonema pulchrum]